MDTLEEVKPRKRYNARVEWIPVEVRTPRNNSINLVLYSDGTITRANIIKKKGSPTGWTPDLFSQPNSTAKPLMWRKPMWDTGDNGKYYRD